MFTRNRPEHYNTFEVNGVYYPMPGVDTALKKMTGEGARFALENSTITQWEHDDGVPKPEWEDIEKEVLHQVDIYNYFLYATKRQENYPSLANQLAMLYDDIKAGNLENGNWIKAIDEVKAQFPKPDCDPPENCPDVRQPGWENTIE